MDSYKRCFDIINLAKLLKKKLKKLKKELFFEVIIISVNIFFNPILKNAFEHIFKKI